VNASIGDAGKASERQAISVAARVSPKRALSWELHVNATSATIKQPIRNFTSHLPCKNDLLRPEIDNNKLVGSENFDKDDPKY
jgi:hypothetical protein